MKNAPFFFVITSVYVMKVTPSKLDGCVNVTFLNDPNVDVPRCNIPNVDYEALVDFVEALSDVVVGNTQGKDAEEYTIRQNQGNLVVKFYGFEFLFPKDDFQITEEFCYEFFEMYGEPMM